MVCVPDRAEWRHLRGVMGSLRQASGCGLLHREGRCSAPNRHVKYRAIGGWRYQVYCHTWRVVSTQHHMQTKPAHSRLWLTLCSERFDRLRYSTFESDVYSPSGRVRGRNCMMYWPSRLYGGFESPLLVGEGGGNCSRGPQAAKPIESKCGRLQQLIACAWSVKPTTCRTC